MKAQLIKGIILLIIGIICGAKVVTAPCGEAINFVWLIGCLLTATPGVYNILEAKGIIEF